MLKAYAVALVNNPVNRDIRVGYVNGSTADLLGDSSIIKVDFLADFLAYKLIGKLITVGRAKLKLNVLVALGLRFGSAALSRINRVPTCVADINGVTRLGITLGRGLISVIRNAVECDYSRSYLSIKVREVGKSKLKLRCTRLLHLVCIEGVGNLVLYTRAVVNVVKNIVFPGLSLAYLFISVHSLCKSLVNAVKHLYLSRCLVGGKLTVGYFELL